MVAALPLLFSASMTTAPGWLPHAPTPATNLSTQTLRHTEVLRIRRDFGDRHWELALDGWTPRGQSRLADVRLWWAQTDRANRRSPIAKRWRKYFEMGVRQSSADHWDVQLRGDEKTFSFAVEADAAGKIHARTSVRTRGGEIVNNCRPVRGRLKARRFLGVPVGVKALELTCIDSAGKRRRGTVPYRDADGTLVYKP